ncbi:universal stress protein [Pseudohongiella spirulinae]|uniref:universal stress protein n=1 Tax=Pseudohongiella spirulinae TaxID=1249552 RepID=UPI0007175A2B|nr:universal stress protein [Pseudohongiella spirulinae]
METLSKILVIIEPEQDSQLALDKAVRLARESGAELELLICDHNPYLEDGYYFDPLQARQLREEHVANHRQLLEEMATVIRAQGFTVSVDALWGNPPYKRIIDKVLKSGPDLLVQSSRHHEKISRLLLSHQDWQLLRYCPCPLLLVKDKPWPAHPVFVVAVDPTHVNDKPAELDNQLTAAGQKFAELTTGELHIFHSCYQPPVSGLYPVKVDLELYKQKTADILSNFSLSDEQLHIEEAEVKKSLPALLERLDASVLVMGAVSRSALDRFLVGSTAERLLDKVHQDVLVLKPEGFRDTVKKAMPTSL